jgi:hypothetical protein
VIGIEDHQVAVPVEQAYFGVELGLSLNRGAEHVAGVELDRVPVSITGRGHVAFDGDHVGLAGIEAERDGIGREHRVVRLCLEDRDRQQRAGFQRLHRETPLAGAFPRRTAKSNAGTAKWDGGLRKHDRSLLFSNRSAKKWKRHAAWARRPAGRTVGSKAGERLVWSLGLIGRETQTSSPTAGVTTTSRIRPTANWL